MQRKDGTLRLLFATEAYGMGIDVNDVRHVIRVGPPSTIESRFKYICLIAFSLMLLIIYLSLEMGK